MKIQIHVLCFVLFSYCGNIQSLAQKTYKRPTRNNDLETKERIKPEGLKFKAPPVKFLKNEYPQIPILKTKLKKLPILIPKIIIKPTNQLKTCNSKSAEKSDSKEAVPTAEFREEKMSETVPPTKASYTIADNHNIDKSKETSKEKNQDPNENNVVYVLGDKKNEVAEHLKTDKESDSESSEVRYSKDGKIYYEESDNNITKSNKNKSIPDVHSFRNVTVLPILREQADTLKNNNSEVSKTTSGIVTNIDPENARNKLENDKHEKTVTVIQRNVSNYVPEGLTYLDKTEDDLKLRTHKAEENKLSSGLDAAVKPVATHKESASKDESVHKKTFPQRLYTDIKLSDQYQEQMKQARSRTGEEKDSAEKSAVDDLIIKEEEIKEVIERFKYPYNRLYPIKKHSHRNPNRYLNYQNYPIKYNNFLPFNYQVNGLSNNQPQRRYYEENMYPIQFYSNLQARNPQDIFATDFLYPGTEYGSNNDLSNNYLLDYYKPDNTYTPPPFKYPFEYDYLDNGVVETNTVQPPYSYYRNLPKIPKKKYYNHPKTYSNYNPTSGYKYKEVVNPGQYLDKIWRTWRKTEVYKKMPRQSRTNRIKPLRYQRQKIK